MNINYKEDWFPNIVERLEILAKDHNLRMGQIFSLVSNISGKNAYKMSNEEILEELDNIIKKSKK